MCVVLIVLLVMCNFAIVSGYIFNFYEILRINNLFKTRTWLPEFKMNFRVRNMDIPY